MKMILQLDTLQYILLLSAILSRLAKNNQSSA